jgi:carbon-monoxide dehydrogenase large subunit
VVNAVVDALRQYGINDVEMPMTPQRVWRAIHRRGGGETAQQDQHWQEPVQSGGATGGAQ